MSDVTRLPSAMAVLLLACAATDAGAQGLAGLPVSIEARVGVGVPLGDLAEDEPGIGAQAGPAFSVGAQFHLSSAFSAYGAYSQTRFGCPRCGEGGIDDEVVDAGGEFGVQAMLGRAGVSPWVRAGGVYRQLTFSGQGGRLSSDAAPGFEAGAGVSVRITRSLSIAPGVRFRTYEAELDLGDAPGRTVNVSQLVADVGLAFRF